MSAPRTPVFITGRFRSGSTLLWSMFRAVPGFTAYYEPCHPNLPAHIQYTRPMSSHLGVQSYWDEYGSIVEDVHRLHRANFGRLKLLLEADDTFSELEAYIDSLIRAAAPNRAVLKFNRVDFRLPWLRARFPHATIIHLHRSPRDSWVSSRRHLAPEKWDDPDCADAYELFQWCAALSEPFPFLFASQQTSYERHYFLWRLSRIMGERQAHCTINYDAELRDEPDRGLAKLVQVGALPAEFQPLAAARIASPERLDWRECHPEEWFATIEQCCERTLSELGLIEEFGVRPLRQIRELHAGAWAAQPQPPWPSLVQQLLDVDVRQQSEQTRLLHEVRTLQRRTRSTGIVIDARSVGEEISGIERYVLGLVGGIARLGAPGKIRVLGRRTGLLTKALSDSPELDFVECRLPRWSPRSQLALPRLLKHLSCRAYHCPDLAVPQLGRGFAIALTVHDMIPHVRRKELHRSLKSKLFPMYDMWLRRACRRADAIITVSEFSRQQIVEITGAPASRIHVIHNGVTRGPAEISAEIFRRDFKIQGPIISYFGRHDPYKNIEGLVRAFDTVTKTTTEPATLVIGGKADPRYQESQRAAAELNLQNRIVFTGFLSEAQRVSLLRASSIFVFPSRHEGFGLPPLEAMAEGIPVIAANATSLPEVLDDAAILVDPGDCAALADAIVRLLRDGALADRLRVLGRARASQFTWERCAAQHLELYERIAHAQR